MHQNSNNPANQRRLYFQQGATTWRLQAAHWRKLIFSQIG
jgi:hypothetical protein